MADIDPTFAIDDFNRPKVLSETETFVNNILTLLLGEPGFYPSLPSIGLNIKQHLYNFFDDINTEDIKAELVRQCRDFLPSVDSGDFDVQKAIYNGNTVLLFQLPTIDDIVKNSVALGVTINEKGEFVYNFIEGKYQTI